MPVLTRSKHALERAGTARAAAPYVREIATDRELREGVRSAIHSLSRIYGEMTADERLRDRVFRTVAQETATPPQAATTGSAMGAAGRILKWGLIGTGLLVAAAAVAGALAYPRSRRRITQTVGDARHGVTSLTGRVRRRPPEQAAEAATDAPDQASEAA